MLLQVEAVRNLSIIYDIYGLSGGCGGSSGDVEAQWGMW
jgi:hypothetical protein